MSDNAMSGNTAPEAVASGRAIAASAANRQRRQFWPLLCYLALLAAAPWLRATEPGVAAPQTLQASPQKREFAYGPHPAQRYDVYLPARPKAAPVVFFVHGGGWAFGDKANAGSIEAKRRRWTAAGAIVISTNYRMLPDADPLTQAQDVAHAVASAQTIIPNLGGAPDGFVLMGHSAGAHLIAMLAASPEMARDAGVRPWRGAVLLDSAAVDLFAIMRGPHPPLYDRAFGDDPGYWRRASPLHVLNAKTAPILAVCSSPRKDSCASNRAFLDKAARNGTRTELLPQAMRHGEINRLLGEDNAYTGQVETFIRGLGIQL